VEQVEQGVAPMELLVMVEPMLVQAAQVETTLRLIKLEL
jgi:hypothetical protein